MKKLNECFVFNFKNFSQSSKRYLEFKKIVIRDFNTFNFKFSSWIKLKDMIIQWIKTSLNGENVDNLIDHIL